MSCNKTRYCQPFQLFSLFRRSKNVIRIVLFIICTSRKSNGFSWTPKTKISTLSSIKKFFVHTVRRNQLFWIEVEFPRNENHNTPPKLFSFSFGQISLFRSFLFFSIPNNFHQQCFSTTFQILPVLTPSCVASTR